MHSALYPFLILFGTIVLGFSPTAHAQGGADTLFVAGPSLEHLSKYLTYWVDSSGNATVKEATAALESGQFKHWKINTTLNLGRNPYPLWLHLQVKNTAPEPEKYWWSLYSHADTIHVFEKFPGGWKNIDTVAYGTPLADRKVKVRFSATEIFLKRGEHKELLLKVLNYRHTQHAITDFTTPEHNLLWEKKFYWFTGFFAGCFLFTGIISLITGIVLRKKVFLLYGVYLLLVLCMNLMEELMVPVVSGPALFYFLSRSHSLPVAIVALAIHYHIILYIIDPGVKKEKFIQVLTRVNDASLAGGVLYWLIYLLFMEKLHHGQWLYNIMWNMGIGMVFLIMLVTLIMIGASVRHKKKLWILGAIVAFLLFYFNPAGYYLNYAGIVRYYHITYPNYFYWIVFAEMIIIGGVLSWQYRKTERDHYLLLEEKAIQEEKVFQREIEILEQERKQIARDLHDDLGTTLSATKLIITNSYSHDKTLVNMITRASTDLRHFFNQLSLSDLKEYGIFPTLRRKINELNSIGKMQFVFIGVGDENLIPGSLKLNILRISTELLSNVLKHSEASEATLQLITEPTQALLMVEDNGKGFNPETIKKGMGIDNVYARVRRCNGEVHISGGASGATTIITLPLTRETYTEKRKR